MRLSARYVCQLIESEPPKLVLVDDTAGRELEIPAVAVAELRQALDMFHAATRPDDLAVLAFVPAPNDVGFILESRPFPTGFVPASRAIELPRPVTDNLVSAIAYFRPALEAHYG